MQNAYSGLIKYCQVAKKGGIWWIETYLFSAFVPIPINRNRYTTKINCTYYFVVYNGINGKYTSNNGSPRNRSINPPYGWKGDTNFAVFGIFKINLSLIILCMDWVVFNHNPVVMIQYMHRESLRCFVKKEASIINQPTV